MSRYSGPGDYSDRTTPRHKARAAKQREAAERNAATPYERRRAFRRAMDLAWAEAAGPWDGAR